MHQALNRPCEHQQHRADRYRNPADRRKHVDIRIEAELWIGHFTSDRIDTGQLCDGARDILRDCDRHPPHAHHQSDDARQRQLGDHAKAYRRDAQFGHGLDQIEPRQPPQ